MGQLARGGPTAMRSLLCVCLWLPHRLLRIFLLLFSCGFAVSKAKHLYNFHNLPEDAFSLKSIWAVWGRNNPITKEAVIVFFFQLKISSSFDYFPKFLWSSSESQCWVLFREQVYNSFLSMPVKSLDVIWMRTEQEKNEIRCEFLVFHSASQLKNPIQDGNALYHGLWSGGEHCFQRTVAKHCSLDWRCTVLWGI